MALYPSQHLAVWRVFVLCVVVCLSFMVHGASTAHAQVRSSQDGGRQGVVIELKPAYPRPGQVVQAKIRQFVLDSDYMLVTWKLNGEVVLQGYEEEQFTFTAGPVGSLQVLEVVLVEQNGGRTETGKKVFRVNDIAYIWEARTYTPPFFMGRPKLSYGASATTVVYPTIYSIDGYKYEVSELLYKWMFDTQEIGSGVGLNSFVIKPSTPFDNLKATVKIFDPTGQERMVYNVAAPSAPAKLMLYVDDPLLGILYQKAVENTVTLSGEELKLVAEPVYGAINERADPSLDYTWNVGGIVYNFPGIITLRPDEGKSGSTNIDLTVVNKAFLLQRLQKRFTVEFDSGDDGSFNWTDSDTQAL